MSCNLKANCDGSGEGGCFTSCCDITCPPDGLCDYIQIEYRAGSNTPGYPCSCPPSFVTSFFGFFTKNFTKKINKEEKIKELETTDGLLGKVNLPPIPSFNLKQNDANFIFAQGCSVPCASITVTITTSNSCGISLSGSVGGSKCCCTHGDGKVYASLGGGGDCKASLSWTQQSVSDGGSVGFPSVNLGNSCCGLWECKRICGSNTSLWKKNMRGNKLKITLNKQEFIKRINKLKAIRVQSRKRRNIRRRS